uniref:Uncharacterized protein n=1 Tax=Anguilla anguilla TaxID=7936 RepID=A0A0E9RZ25_ANGAN
MDPTQIFATRGTSWHSLCHCDGMAPCQILTQIWATPEISPASRSPT